MHGFTDLCSAACWAKKSILNKFLGPWAFKYVLARPAEVRDSDSAGASSAGTAAARQAANCFNRTATRRWSVARLANCSCTSLFTKFAAKLWKDVLGWQFRLLRACNFSTIDMLMCFWCAAYRVCVWNCRQRRRSTVFCRITSAMPSQVQHANFARMSWARLSKSAGSQRRSPRA